MWKESLVGALLLVSCAPGRSTGTAAEDSTDTTAGETAGDERVARPALSIGVPAAQMAAAAKPLRLTFFDTGQGDCALMQCPNGANILIDCGSSSAGRSDWRLVRDRLTELIGERGVIDVLVLTHPDIDHYGWVERVVADHPIARAIHSLTLSNYDARSSGFEQWLRSHRARFASDTERPEDVPRVAIEALPLRYHDGEMSDRFDCGDVDVRILAANVQATHRGSAWRTNTPSIVLRVHREIADESFTAILTADATVDTEEAILGWFPKSAGQPDLLDADLVRVAHHGSEETSTSLEWVERTSPRVAVLSAGRHGSYWHPRCAVTERILTHGTLDGAACHESVCGNGAQGGPTLGTCSGHSRQWCTFASDLSFYETFSSGDITVEFDGSLRVSAERGEREDCGP